jgi:hypothetical protein
MSRNAREVYKRGRPEIEQPDGAETPEPATIAAAQTDWEILAQQTVDERRKEKRVNLRFPVQVSGFTSTGKLFCKNTYTTDISATGCRVVLDEVVARGDMIGIKLLIKAEPGAPITKPQMFQILWRARKDNVWMVGALKMTEDKFWQVEFPDKSPFKAS